MSSSIEGDTKLSQLFDKSKQFNKEPKQENSSYTHIASYDNNDAFNNLKKMSYKIIYTYKN